MTVLALKRKINKQMRAKGWLPTSADVVGKYMVFMGVRWHKNELEEELEKDEDNRDDPLSSYEITRFFITISKYIEGYKPKQDKDTKKAEAKLLEEKTSITDIKNLNRLEYDKKDLKFID